MCQQISEDGKRLELKKRSPMKNNDVISSDGTVFGFESLQNELIRSSDEILRDLKADIDPFVTGKSMNQSMRSNNSQEKS